MMQQPFSAESVDVGQQSTTQDNPFQSQQFAGQNGMQAPQYVPEHPHQYQQAFWTS